MWPYIIGFVFGAVTLCWAWVVSEDTKEQRIKDLEAEAENYQKHYAEMVGIGHKAFVEEFPGVLTIGSFVSTDGFRWALAQAREAVQLRHFLSQCQQGLAAKRGDTVGPYGDIALKVGDKVRSRWGQHGTVVRVGQTSATIDPIGGGYPSIIPLDSLRLTYRG